MWAVGGKGSLHCDTLAVTSLSYARATLRGRSCPTLYHQVGKADAHQLFQLTDASNGKLPMSMYMELVLYFLGIMVPKVGVQITQEPKELLDECHKNKLPGIIGWNFIKLAYQVLIQKNMGNIALIILAVQQVLVDYYFPSFVYSTIRKWVEYGQTVLLDSSNSLKKAQQFSINVDWLLGKVLIGNTSQSICVPGNSALTIPGRLGRNTKISCGTPCLVDTAPMHNLPQGISVNLALFMQKAMQWWSLS